MPDCWGGGVSFVQLYEALNDAGSAKASEKGSHLIWAAVNAETLAKSGIRTVRRDALRIAEKARSLAKDKDVKAYQISGLRHDAERLGHQARKSCKSK